MSHKMSHEEILDLAYSKYKRSIEENVKKATDEGILYPCDCEEIITLSSKTFNHRCMTDPDFAHSVGLKFDTRDLTWQETVQWVMKYTDVELENLYIVEEAHKDSTPKKMARITYENQEIEFYK